ncbi:MAG: response regulator [Candidatus Competibacteraceae bacterium]
MAKILIVEDRENVRRQWVKRLRRSGYEVIEAEDGAEGVAKAAAEKPDVILMDMGLPVLDGYEATRRIKADPETRAIPVIALTGEVVDRQKVIDAGCDDFLKKPVPANGLLAKLQTLLGSGDR